MLKSIGDWAYETWIYGKACFDPKRLSPYLAILTVIWCICILALHFWVKPVTQVDAAINLACFLVAGTSANYFLTAHFERKQARAKQKR